MASWRSRNAGCKTLAFMILERRHYKRGEKDNGATWESQEVEDGKAKWMITRVIYEKIPATLQAVDGRR